MNNSEQQRAIEFENVELTNIIQRLEYGQYAIPVFQRDFVWDKNNIRDLWDSIYRYYPIGSLLIWETEEQLPRHRNILNIELKENVKGKFNYVLDGQQRITSIIGAVKGAKRNRTSFKLFFNISKAHEMSKKDFLEQINNSPFLTEKELKDSSSSDQIVPLEKLLNFDSAIYRNLGKIDYDLSDFYLTTSEKLRKDYKVSIIKLNNIPIEEICDIFTRVNQKGKRLSLVDLMVAKTYKQDEFYLRDNIDEIQDYLLKEGYDGIDELIFLRAVSANKTQRCSEADILDINSDDILSLWEKTTTSIIQAIRYLKDDIGIKSPKILPYSTMLVPLSYFFFKLGNKTFYEKYKSAIKKWFWRSSFSGRYQAHTNEIIHNDCLWFDKLIQNNDKLINDSNVYEPSVQRFEISEEAILETVLNLNNAFSNSILCLLASKRPIDFYNHQTIKINEVIIKGKKSELHHIFPRNSKTGKKNSENIDNIANICFLPRDTNRLFTNKEPSNYFSISLKSNSIHFPTDLESHLIPSSDNSPIFTDEYDKFLKQRATLLKDEIKNILEYPDIPSENNDDNSKNN